MSFKVICAWPTDDVVVEGILTDSKAESEEVGYVMWLRSTLNPDAKRKWCMTLSSRAARLLAAELLVAADKADKLDAGYAEESMAFHQKEMEEWPVCGQCGGDAATKDPNCNLCFTCLDGLVKED